VTDEDTIGTQLIEAEIEVHRELGFGVLESVYEAALAYELKQMRLCVERQVTVSLNRHYTLCERFARISL
jgi:GxxExxY protein